ncbi:MAG: radical SAM family heme chaperone HemW [Planctomycetes bacterium]|nr:radical SAM family heme chaperone HemW [Planctomycetota bacterium]
MHAPPWLVPTAAYIHVPFCAHHCGYCDFAVAVGQDERIDAYLDALEIELAGLNEPQPMETLFFGGGTPTYLPHRALERLLKITLRWLPLRDGHEFSVEANPSGLDAEKIALLADFGVNRLSLGVQSFEPTLLRVLERDHEPDDVRRVLEFIRPRVGNVSIDLIFGVPGQTAGQWHNDLARGLALEPNHIASYGLTYEKGTRLWKQRERGDVLALDEDSEHTFYLRVMETLEGAGFEHYEISNFARPGFRCRHNQVYWANHAYHGFGVGAARYVQGVRELNTRDVRTYIQRLKSGRAPTFQSERLEPRERAMETIAVQLRRADGVNREEFRTQTGFTLEELVGPALRELEEQGLVRDHGTGITLTRKGKCLADAVVMKLMR